MGFMVKLKPEYVVRTLNKKYSSFVGHLVSHFIKANVPIRFKVAIFLHFSKNILCMMSVQQEFKFNLNGNEKKLESLNLSNTNTQQLIKIIEQ